MAILLEETLYNLDTRGSVRQWSISVEKSVTSDEAVIEILQGLKDGKLTSRKTIISKGKNIGKANETTPYQQAVSEAKSKTKKQRDKGYQEEVPDVSSLGKNGLGFAKPMLALDRKKAKVVTLADYTVQPKLDGFRLLALNKGGWQLYTRQAKEISVPHIEEALNRLKLPEGTTLDGELYCHDLTFQQISSAAKKVNPNTALLAYHVYDVITDQTYDDRYKFLLEEVYRIGFPLLGVACRNLLDKSIEAAIKSGEVDADYIDESELEKTWDTLHSSWVSQGYEGSIARCRKQSYKSNGRDNRMIKRKDFIDEEFEIIGIDRTVKPAPVVGDPSEYPEGSVVDGYAYQAQFVCARDGAEFRASMEGGVLLRAKLWAAVDEDFTGKQATCKYFEWTDDGLPRHPIARRRDEL